MVLKVVGIVRQKLKEQEQKPRHSHQTIEQILNESGICGLGPQPMAEFRAEIYHALGMGLCQPGTLKESLQGFIVDYEVFSVSELRYYFPGDLEAESTKVWVSMLGCSKVWVSMLGCCMTRIVVMVLFRQKQKSKTGGL
ncbi:hypothetical protein [Thalassomonas haliotis]|uniref:Uncharacterized protein n=1 Tax=Thalassomonas haliotis TaxID=485448 RepID=A0ABY7VFD4_9GAMM|nr:hypothetical protein [Thalassomonas haliotis]WDE11603.1 hypothetical protein H3N35_25950 [Thalassomonas haliotis]